MRGAATASFGERARNFSTRVLAPGPKTSLLTDGRGAVAFEMIFVLSVFVALLFPLADLAIASFQFISAWEALRTFGQYLQYNPPPDVTDLASWKNSLSTTKVSGYPIGGVTVTCGEDAVGACPDATLVPKYYSFQTTVTLSPVVLTALCSPSCTYTLSYRERFQ